MIEYLRTHYFVLNTFNYKCLSKPKKKKQIHIYIPNNVIYTLNVIPELYETVLKGRMMQIYSGIASDHAIQTLTHTITTNM